MRKFQILNLADSGSFDAIVVRQGESVKQIMPGDTADFEVTGQGFVTISEERVVQAFEGGRSASDDRPSGLAAINLSSSDGKLKLEDSEFPKEAAFDATVVQQFKRDGFMTQDHETFTLFTEDKRAVYKMLDTYPGGFRLGLVSVSEHTSTGPLASGQVSEGGQTQTMPVGGVEPTGQGGQQTRAGIAQQGANEPAGGQGAPIPAAGNQFQRAGAAEAFSTDPDRAFENGANLSGTNTDTPQVSHEPQDNRDQSGDGGNSPADGGQRSEPSEGTNEHGIGPDTDGGDNPDYRGSEERRTDPRTDEEREEDNANTDQPVPDDASSDTGTVQASERAEARRDEGQPDATAEERNVTSARATAQYETKHRGKGSYSIVDKITGEEVVEGLKKTDAQTFDALSDEEKVEYVKRESMTEPRPDDPEAA